MMPLPKFPFTLKVLWFVPFPLLLVMVAAVELPLDGLRAYTSLLYLAIATLGSLLAAAIGTILWLGLHLIQPRS